MREVKIAISPIPRSICEEELVERDQGQQVEGEIALQVALGYLFLLPDDLILVDVEVIDEKAEDHVDGEEDLLDDPEDVEGRVAAVVEVYLERSHVNIGKDGRNGRNCDECFENIYPKTFAINDQFGAKFLSLRLNHP